jgi:hypothetical protein
LATSGSISWELVDEDVPTENTNNKKNGRGQYVKGKRKRGKIRKKDRKRRKNTYGKKSVNNNRKNNKLVIVRATRLRRGSQC